MVEPEIHLCTRENGEPPESPKPILNSVIGSKGGNPMLRMCGASLPIKCIVNEDLGDLKGKWDGVRNSIGKFSAETLRGLRTLLEIKNPRSPVQASLFFYETKKGIKEYSVLLDITEGKLVSRRYNVTLTLSRKGSRLRLKGEMDVGHYHEELLFWKNTEPPVVHPANRKLFGVIAEGPCDVSTRL